MTDASADTPLQPPTLVAPAPVPAVGPATAAERIPLQPQEQAALDAQVRKFAADLLSFPIEGTDFQHRISSINNLGESEIRQSANVANRMLDRPMNAMNGLRDGASPVARGLLELRKTIESLDPAKENDLFGARKLLGLIPFGSKIQDYFRRYESAQAHLNAIIESLYHSKDALQHDNAAIEQEKANMWALMGRLRQYAYLVKALADALGAEIATVEARDPERSKVLKEEALFYALQKHQDILTQMAVNVQGYLALDLVKKNNVELVKGVDRATTTTVSALRTAVIVAQALANQRLVLDQISALNTTTSNMIESTSMLLKQQGAAINKQAAESTVDVEKLKTAFQNVYAAMDAVSTYKVAAIASMEQTIATLDGEVKHAQTYLDKTRAETVAGALTSLPPATAADGSPVVSF